MTAVDLADTIRAANGDPALEAAAIAAAPPAARDAYLAATVAYRAFAECDYLHRAVLAAMPSKRAALIEAASPQARANLLWVMEEHDALDREMRLRELRLASLRDNPAQVALLRQWYAMGNIARFICDWAIAADPRRANRGRSTTVPFLLFRKQIEMCGRFWATYRKPGGAHLCVPKSREVGATETSVSFITTLALLVPGFVAILGSALERDIDNGAAESLFSRVRAYLNAVPEEFRCGYTAEKCSTNMRILLPQTGAQIIGNAGSNIARGKRASMIFLDEHAFIPQAHLVKESVSASSRVIIAISSVNGISGPSGEPNQFYVDCHSPGIETFYFRWRDDTRTDPDTGMLLKTQTWYEEQKAKLGSVIVAQTLDCDWHASISGACIPVSHIMSCVGLAERLGIRPVGSLRVAYDPAGNSGTGDKYGYVAMRGTSIFRAETWSGLNSNESLRKVYAVLDELGAQELIFDVHGVGDHTASEMASLEALRDPGRRKYRPAPFNSNRFRKTDKKGEGVLYRPHDPIYGAARGLGFERTQRHEDVWGNFRAQCFGQLAWLAKNSHAVQERLSRGEDVSKTDHGTLLFIDPGIPELSRLITDLGQPAFRENAAGLQFVDKGSPSPTLADCTAMASAPRHRPIVISDEALAALGRPAYGSPWG